MIPYVVKKGDFLLAIAHRQGFDAVAVWSDPKNGDLRTLRGDGSILASGDILWVPEPPPPNWLPVNVGSLNRFVATVPTVETTVRFAFNGKPCANAAYRVVCDGTEQKGTSGADGTVKFSARPMATSATVYFDDRKVHFDVNLGHLDPCETRSGLIQRLNHLGYLRNSVLHGTATVSVDDALEDAIVAFQKASNLPATGECDATTQAALVKAHGS